MLVQPAGSPPVGGILPAGTRAGMHAFAQLLATGSLVKLFKQNGVILHVSASSFLLSVRDACSILM
jgi:hypothetical protein